MMICLKCQKVLLLVPRHFAVNHSSWPAILVSSVSIFVATCSQNSKLQEGVVDCALLAIAGLNRMDMTQHATKILDTDVMLPAVAQGAIGITCRSGDVKQIGFLDKLNHEETRIAVECERSFLAALDGSCRTPIAGYARKDGDKLKFDGLIASLDGSEILETSREANWSYTECCVGGQRCWRRAEETSTCRIFCQSY